MPREVITTSYTEEEFKELLKSIISESIKEEIDKALERKVSNKPDKPFFDRNETAEMLGISLVTLHNKSMDGTIEHRRIGRRILYKWEDIERALMTYAEKRASRYKGR